MKTSLFALLMLLSMQGPQSQTPLASLAGTWTTTFTPPSGSAPMIAPSFTIEIKDGETLVTFLRDKAPRKATPLANIGETPEDDVSVLLLPESTPTIRMLLRPTGPGQLRFELYLEQARGGRGGYHEEIFKKR